MLLCYSFKYSSIVYVATFKVGKLKLDKPELTQLKIAEPNGAAWADAESIVPPEINVLPGEVQLDWDTTSTTNFEFFLFFYVCPMRKAWQWQLSSSIFTYRLMICYVIYVIYVLK